MGDMLGDRQFVFVEPLSLLRRICSTTRPIAAVVVVMMSLAGQASGQAKVELPGVENPTAVHVHGGRLYVVDGRTTVRVYSAEDFAPITMFGEDGSGPGQFAIRPDHHVELAFLDDRVLANSDGKISFFTLDGSFLEEKTVPPGTFGYRPLGGGFVCMASASESGVLYFEFRMTDSDLNATKRVTRVRNDYQEGEGIKVFSVTWQFHTADGKLFIQEREKGLTVDVYDQSGNPVAVISAGFEEVKVTEEVRMAVHDEYRTSPYSSAEYESFIRDALIFPEHLPAVRAWNVADERVYVFTHELKDGLNEVVVFGMDGEEIRRTHVPFSIKGPGFERPLPYTVHEGEVYQMVKSRAPGHWELHVDPIF
jgi:hypothetical protein